MWIREWKCLCPQDKLNGFLKYLDITGVEDTQSIKGCCGYSVFTRRTDRMVEVTLHTYWENKDLMKAYAGDNMYKAVLYPEDELYEIIPDKEVAIFEISSSSIIK